MGFVIVLIACVIAFTVLLFWLKELLILLSMRDQDFPGHNDKLIWFLFMFFGTFLGALVFCYWRNFRFARLNEEQRVAQYIKQSLPRTPQTGEQAQ